MTKDNTQQLQSDKMRVKGIGKLLTEMSLPAIFSMLVQALYNIVDSLFLTNISYISDGYKGSNIGIDSFNAVSIVMPMTMLVTALAIGIGVGANAFIARKLGEGNRDAANKAAKTAVVMGLFSWAVLIVLAFTVSKPFVAAFVNNKNASDVDFVVSQGAMYLTIYLAASGGFIIDIILARILQATGNMKVPMFSQLIGALTNIGLDALFIMVFKMGVLGAILATVIGQWLAAIFDLAFFVFKKQDVSVSLKGFRFEKKYFGVIAKIGLPAFVMNAMGSVVTIIMNVMLRDYTNGITVLSAYFKVQSFIFMPVFGLMQGTMPILSYNYGANQRKRFNKTFNYALYVAMAVLAVGLVIFQTMPETLMSIFESKTVSAGQTQAELDAANAILVKEGAHAFRCISISFMPAAFSILLINMLQSINCPVSSLLMSLSRQLLFLIPSAILFNMWMGQQGIWICYPFAEIMSLVVFSGFAVNNYKKQWAYKENQYAQHLLEQPLQQEIEHGT
ncbi:MAG: MATE family efflux transporter [Corallococcus sp.]|nr:MATE family efflux transporter [Corallococcus sp.]MCM1359862.1 MATE family efflux transporter [Corallococcus sp.]MCM1395296.1 MATE family efflux transporter [Corallococcus sp.]